jgi:hypothetical protein
MDQQTLHTYAHHSDHSAAEAISASRTCFVDTPHVDKEYFYVLDTDHFKLSIQDPGICIIVLNESENINLII